MNIKVLLVVLSFAAVALAAGPYAEKQTVYKHGHGQQYQQVGSSKFDTLKNSLTGKYSNDGAETILSRWCRSSQMSQNAITKSFKQLVESIKQTPANQLEQLTQAVLNERPCQQNNHQNTNNKNQETDAGAEELVKDVYMDALISAETRESMKQLVRCIDSGKVDKVRANFYLTRLALADEDTVEDSVVMQLAESFAYGKNEKQTGPKTQMQREVVDSIERQKMFAVTAGLSKNLRYQQEQQQVGQKNKQLEQLERMVEQVIKSIIERFITNANYKNSQDETSDEKEQANRNAALKALANIPSEYYTKETVLLLMKLASDKNQESKIVRQSALEALEGLEGQEQEQEEKLHQLVKRLIKDVNESTEVRVAAYRCLMTLKTLTIEDVDELIQLIQQQQSQSQNNDKQFVMYVISHLFNVRSSNNRDYEQIQKILHENKQHYMAVQLLAKKYKHQQDVRKYSRNFQLEQTINKINSGLILESDVIYSQEKRGNADYLPKLMRLNISMPVLGKNVNVMEISLRQDNMEQQLIESIPSFDKSTSIDMDKIERIVDTIKTISQKSQQQKEQYNKNQNQNKNSNNKYEQEQDKPEADLTIKVDGCTVLYVSLDDFVSTENNKRMRRSTTGVEDVLEMMKMKRGGSFAFNRGAHLAINKRLAGILDIDAVISAAVRMESRVRSLSSRQMDSTDSFEVSTHFQPRFSLEAFVGPKTSEKRLLQRVSTESALGLRMKYIRSELVDVQLDLPLEEMELFKVQSDIVDYDSATGKYTYPYKQGQEQDDDEQNGPTSSQQKQQKWLSSSLLRQSGDKRQSKKYSNSMELPTKVARVLGLDGKVEFVYSPEQLSYLARAVVKKLEPTMQGYRVQIQQQQQKPTNKQQQQYAIVLSAPGSTQIDRTIQMRVLKQQTQAGRVTFKTDLISPFAAGSAQLELIKDERQVSVRLETISRQGKSAKLEAGLQQTSVVMTGKKQITLKPYMTIAMPQQQPMHFEGLVSIQQGPKTVFAYEFTHKQSQQQQQGNSNAFLRGKIIADISESDRSQSKSRRSMSRSSSSSSSVERFLQSDITVSSESVAQLGQLAVKVHSMIESKAQESIGFDVQTQYQTAPHKRQEQSKFAMKLYYQAPQTSQSSKNQQKRQAFYMEHSCTKHPEHSFLVQMSHAYKPYEQHDLSVNVHLPSENKKQQDQEQYSYSHQLKYNPNNNKAEITFELKATPFDYEREAKLIVQSASTSGQQQRSSRIQGQGQSQQQQFKGQFVVVDKISKETTVDVRGEMEQKIEQENLIDVSVKLDNGKRQYRLAHQARRQNKQQGKYEGKNKLQIDVNGQQTSFDYELRVEKLGRYSHEIIVDGLVRSSIRQQPIKVESKTRVQYQRNQLSVEHKSQSSNDYQLELIAKPFQGVYKFVHQSPEITVEMMARASHDEPTKQIQWQIKKQQQSRSSMQSKPFVHQTKFVLDETTGQVYLQSQQTGTRKSYKIESSVHLPTGPRSKHMQHEQKKSYVVAVWNNEQSKLNVEYEPEQSRCLAQVQTERISHKTQIQARQQQEQGLYKVQSRTEKNQKLVLEIDGQLSMERQGRTQFTINMPQYYKIKMDITNTNTYKNSKNQQLSLIELLKPISIRVQSQKGDEANKDVQYEKFNMMFEHQEDKRNAKFEFDATDAKKGRRSSVALDMWAQQDKPTTFAMQTPQYVGQGEFVYMSREQAARVKSLLKDLERNERYELDTQISRDHERRSHLKLDTPKHVAQAYYEPQNESAELSVERRQQVQGRQQQPWSLKAKLATQNRQNEDEKKRQVELHFDNENESHEHSFEYSPRIENVKFQSERQQKNKQRNGQWWKIQGDLNSYRRQDQREKESMFSLESQDYDALMKFQPFGEQLQKTQWKLRTRRSINEGELSRIFEKTSKHSSNKDETKKTSELASTYKAMMRHLTDKELVALLDASCESTGERFKVKLHAPKKFSTRYEHDYDYEQDNEDDDQKMLQNTNKHQQKKGQEKKQKKQMENVQKSKFDFEFEAPSRKFQHLSSFEMDHERDESSQYNLRNLWGNKRSIVSTRVGEEFDGENDRQNPSIGFWPIDARIKSKTIYQNDELYNIDGELNLLQQQQQHTSPRQGQRHEFVRPKTSTLKFNTPEWKTQVQYQPEEFTEFEFVTPQQDRHVARFETPLTRYTTRRSFDEERRQDERQQDREQRQGREQENLAKQMLKFVTKSYNKQGAEQYKFEGQFPRRFFQQQQLDQQRRQDQYDEQEPTKFEYQDQQYKAGFDFDTKSMSKGQWYINDKSGFEHSTQFNYGQQQRKQQQGENKGKTLFTTATKTTRFGTLAYVELSENGQEITMKIVTPIVKGVISTEQSEKSSNEQIVRMRFENNKHHEHSQKVRQYYLSPSSYYKTSQQWEKQVKEFLYKLSEKSFSYESEIRVNKREQLYKITTQIQREQQVVFDSTVHVDRRQGETQARVHVAQQFQGDLIVDHKTGVSQIRAQSYDKQQFSHETIVERSSTNQQKYQIQSRTTYKQKDLVKIVGVISSSEYQRRGNDDNKSQIEAQLFDNQYRVMIQKYNQQEQNQEQKIVKIVVEDDKRQLVHFNEFKYDEQREVLQFATRTYTKKYNNEKQLYKAQGVVDFSSNKKQQRQISHFQVDLEKSTIKGQYVPNKEFSIVVDGEQMKHMTKVEIEAPKSLKSLKDVKVKSYTKFNSLKKLSYEFEANLENVNTKSVPTIFKIKGQGYQQERPIFELIAFGQQGEKSMAKLSTGRSSIEMIVDHSSKQKFELRAQIDNKKYQHETIVSTKYNVEQQQQQQQEYYVRSLTTYNNKQLVKLAAQFLSNDDEQQQQQQKPKVSVDVSIYDEQYKIQGQAIKTTYNDQRQSTPFKKQQQKVYKYYLNVEDNKRDIVSENEFVYDKQSEQILFKSRVGDSSNVQRQQREREQLQSRYYNSYDERSLRDIYKAQGRIQLNNNNKNNQESSELQYQSQRSQMKVQYKPKKQIIVDIETPELEHLTKLNMNNKSQSNTDSWKQAFKQMSIRSQLDAPLRSSPFNKYTYNFGAEFDATRKPSNMIALKLY